MTINRESIRKIDCKGVTTGRRLAAIHPGEMLLIEFIESLGLTRYKVAKAIRVQQRRIDEICSAKRAITPDTALRLTKLFGMDAQVWMNLQVQYDLETAELCVQQTD